VVFPSTEHIKYKPIQFFAECGSNSACALYLVEPFVILVRVISNNNVNHILYPK
jgi:hypothetical protein